MGQNSKSDQGSAYYQQTISRSMLINVLNSAIELKEYRFARQLALSWLSVYPGDLEINRGLARIFILEGKQGQAIQILEKICQIDPEDVLAQKQLFQIYDPSQADMYERVRNDLYVLGQQPDDKDDLPGWAPILKSARKALFAGNKDEAETMLYQVLGITREQLIVAITHIEIIRKIKDHSNYLKFAELYNDQWPDAVLFKLALAEAKLEVGDEGGSVALLHQCVAQDAAGQVPIRWWGEGHPYKPLWPEQLDINLDIAVPATIATQMGWNRLSSVAGEPVVSTYSETETDVSSFLSDVNDASNRDLESQRGEDFENKLKYGSAEKSALVKNTEANFADIARGLNLPQVAQTDGRFPIYVIFSSKTGLKEQYGEQSFTVIDKELRTLADAVKNHASWGSLVFYPDDFETTGKYGMKTTSSVDPAKYKQAIIELDKALAKKGGRIGAMLIVGGPKAVPFHSLPNPTTDSDEVVLSDNPYASLDTNYFIPEWPIGRIMGEENHDTGLLLQQIRSAITYHSKVGKNTPLPSTSQIIQLIQALVSLFRAFKPPVQQFTPSGAFGLSASVWKKSSAMTFSTIGDEKSLLTCPPTTSGGYDADRITGNPLAYFNLHGLPTTAEWYGQGNPQERGNGPDYPVAIKASDLSKGEKSSRFVFTEACYGGYVVDKTENSSMALRFASIGAQGLIGSTCISYGSVTTPLVGADLLAYYFWTALKQGFAGGDALMQAKLSLVREMNNRQGYLDGEDQKTLISFVYYGDPLVYLDPEEEARKRVVRYQSYPQVKAVSDFSSDSEKKDVQDKWVRYAKDAVAEYIPEFESEDFTVSTQEVVVDKRVGGSLFPGLGTHQVKQVILGRTVVIFKKKIRIGDQVHTQYARVTLNQDGKLMKVAFSR